MHNVNLASCTTRTLVLNYNMNSTVSYYRPFDSLEKKSPGVLVLVRIPYRTSKKSHPPFVEQTHDFRR